MNDEPSNDLLNEAEKDGKTIVTNLLPRYGGDDYKYSDEEEDQYEAEGLNDAEEDDI
jgi:hypothetical protein